VTTVKDFMDRRIGKRGRRYQHVNEADKALFSYLHATKNASVARLMITFDIGRDRTEAWRLGTDVAKSSKKICKIKIEMLLSIQSILIFVFYMIRLSKYD